MPKFFVNVAIIFNYIRCSLHIILFYFHKNRLIIKADASRWLLLLRKKYSLLTGFVYLLAFYPEFRNVFYLRIGISKYFLNFFCPRLKTLIFSTDNIGEGLFIQHGFGTSIGADSIGKNCLINQQVTIGDYHEGCPTILNNVSIRSGAIVMGKITIGNNVVIGANAIVYTNVPDNCTVFASPSRIMHWDKSEPNGQIIRHELLCSENDWHRQTDLSDQKRLTILDQN